MVQQSKCPFCDKSQAYRYLKESKYAFVLYPKSPAIPYHLLLVPKRHIQCFDQLNDSEVLEMHKLLRQLVALGRANIIDFIGYNILSNNGSEAVNQRVKHCHLHLFLRSKIDQAPIITVNARDPMPLTDIEKGYLETMKRWRKSE